MHSRTRRLRRFKPEAGRGPAPPRLPTSFPFLSLRAHILCLGHGLRPTEEDHENSQDTFHLDSPHMNLNRPRPRPAQGHRPRNLRTRSAPPPNTTTRGSGTRGSPTNRRTAVRTCHAAGATQLPPWPSPAPAAEVGEPPSSATHLPPFSAPPCVTSQSRPTSDSLFQNQEECWGQKVLCAGFSF